MSHDVYQLMREDHQAILAGLKQILDHTDGDIPRRVKHFRDVKQTFERSTAFKEEDFYPAARAATGLNTEIDGDMEAHDEERALLRAMDTVSPDASEFMDAAARLHANFRWHADHEERALWHQVQDRMPAETVRHLGVSCAKRRGLPLI